MSAPLVTRELGGELSVRAEGGDGRTLDIALLNWDEVGQTDEGPEVFRRGAFDDVDPARVTVESQRHGGSLVGRGVTLDQGGPAPVLSARISRTPAGDELLQLVADQVLTRASVAFHQLSGGARVRSDGVTERTRVDLRRVAVLERGAYPGAGVLAVREDQSVADTALHIRQDEPPPSDTPPDDKAPPMVLRCEVVQEGKPPADGTAAAPGVLMERMERLEGRVGTMFTFPIAGPVQYRASSLGELFNRAFEDEELRGAFAGGMLNRALADQITTDNPGVVPPAVISRAATIVNRGRPTVDAVGTAALPASGMTVNWPVLTTPLAGLMAKQTTQKAAVVSAKVSFGSASTPVQTFAGASDIALQLVRRSDPPYLEGYARAMLSAWADLTDAQFVVDLKAAATGGTVILTPASNAAAIVAALVDASLLVQSATGSPASVVSVAPDLFAAIAKAWAPTSINPTATGGTAMASELTVSVSGLTITNDRNHVAGTGLVTNREAASWLEDGPFNISVDDAEKIGQNVAYWSMGASAVYVPTGIVKIAAT